MGWAELTARGREATAQLLGVQNPEQKRADLKTFFGPRADVYLATYEKMLIAQDRGGFVLTWSWPGFLLGFPWFFYRRMYAIGALLILVPLVIGILFPSASLASMAGIAAYAKYFYVQSALRRTQKADTLGLAGAERADYLHRAGGVSIVAGVLTGLLYAFFIAAAFYEIAFKTTGAP
jgi:hypothetical protein